jgi:uncharacterized protein (DUF2062 family)
MRRVVAPIRDQLQQGTSPDKIALTVALGLVLAIFPLLGTTTALCALVAYRLRLNQPIIQLVNYAAYPLQFVALIPFIRAGEALFGQPHVSLSVSMLTERLRADVFKFVGDFGLLGLRAVAAWCLVAPLVGAAVYFSTRPALRALAARRGA